MLNDDFFSNLEERSRQPFESLQHSKRDDVVFFRLENPSQLENEYEFGPVLGEGTFGIVFRGIRKCDNTPCAIKKILRERTFSASERARLDREISILRHVKHPGIIELFAVAESPKILFLITELCEGESLAARMDAHPEKIGLEEIVVVEIIKQVASALSYLHNRGIVHRDLKAGNIMLLHKVDLRSRQLTAEENFDSNVSTINPSQNPSHKPTAGVTSIMSAPTEVQPQQKQMRRVTAMGRVVTRALNTDTKKYTSKNVVSNVPESNIKSIAIADVSLSGKNSLPIRPPPAALRTKIIDFGLAIEVRKNEEVLANQCGTPLYMAPEVIKGRSYTRQCDVWSLGVLMFLLLTGKVIFNAQNEDQLLEQLNKIDTSKLVQSITYISLPARNCLKHVLHMDPAYRYSASELLLDPWIGQVGIVNQEDPLPDARQLQKRLSPDGVTDASGGVNFATVNNDAIASGNVGFSGNRPQSVGTNQVTNVHSTTNVLTLMKQFHKELTESKQLAPTQTKDSTE